MTGTMNRWTFSGRGLYYRSQIRYYSMRFDTPHACQNAHSSTKSPRWWCMTAVDIKPLKSSQTELQQSPHFQLQLWKILSIAQSNADFRRSTHFLWVKTSFEFDKIPPRDWYSQRNVMIFDFFIFPYQQQAGSRKYCSGENSHLLALRIVDWIPYPPRSRNLPYSFDFPNLVRKRPFLLSSE